MHEMNMSDIHNSIQKLPFVAYGPNGSQKLLIDTGSPNSYGTIKEISLGGKTHRITNDFMNSISKYMPDNVVALIGMDIIRHHDFELLAGSNEVSFPNESLSPLANIIELDAFMEIPAFEIKVTYGTLKCLLDTGAHISYIARRHTEVLTAIDQTKDFNPIIGVFETPIYAYDVILNGIKTTVRVGNLPEMSDLAIFGITGLDAVMGLPLFSDKRVVYASSTNTLSYE